ncbi:MAG: hypothetical protein P4L51_01220 [Puia sp.]|nr:hypothetical protein [Puia sp.]
MKRHFILSYAGLLFLAGVLSSAAVGAQQLIGKIDTTVKTGKVGYRVVCKNKSYIDNELIIRPIGFDNQARDLDFMIRGRVGKSEILDLNSDGYPDLVLYIYNDSNAVYGTIYAFLSEANKSIVACMLPDLMLNGKVNTGYKGHDQFALIGNYLQQKFPIYKTDDGKSGASQDTPTGDTRVLLYQLSGNAENGYKFNLVRFYETH